VTAGTLQRSAITWLVLDRARACLQEFRTRVGPEAYEVERASLQDFLCGYFTSGTCRHRQGSSIAPMRSSNTQAGGKCLKVRWAIPGGGKSGGFRLAIVAYCEAKVVKVAGAWMRRVDPSDDEFATAYGDG